jgi:hypothetical protein
MTALILAAVQFLATIPLPVTAIFAKISQSRFTGFGLITYTFYQRSDGFWQTRCRPRRTGVFGTGPKDWQ